MSINYFDEIFFSNYLNDEDEVLDVCHKHISTILDTMVIYSFFWVILPTFFYYNNSFKVWEIIPSFFYYEIYLFIIYIVLIYKVFDWYNDVWIITNKWIVDLDWKFMRTDLVYIDYNDVKWIEIREESIIDWLLGKWYITIHLQSDWAVFALEDAKNPKEVRECIQWILEEKERGKKEKDKDISERLLSTMKAMVKEHLEKYWFEWKSMNEDEEIEEENETKILEKILNKKWTIDLR